MWIDTWIIIVFVVVINTIVYCNLTFECLNSFFSAAKELALKRVSQAQKGSEFATRAGFGNAFKDFPKASLNLIRNIPFMCVNGAAVTEWFIISSLATFGSKFMETQFNISASDAALKTGECVRFVLSYNLIAAK